MWEERREEVDRRDWEDRREGKLWWGWKTNKQTNSKCSPNFNVK